MQFLLGVLDLAAVIAIIKFLITNSGYILMIIAVIGYVAGQAGIVFYKRRTGGGAVRPDSDGLKYAGATVVTWVSLTIAIPASYLILWNVGIVLAKQAVILAEQATIQNAIDNKEFIEVNPQNFEASCIVWKALDKLLKNECQLKYVKLRGLIVKTDKQTITVNALGTQFGIKMNSFDVADASQGSYVEVSGMFRSTNEFPHVLSDGRIENV